VGSKLLEKIDTVSVALEPAGRPFASPTGNRSSRPIFGTPPNRSLIEFVA